MPDADIQSPPPFLTEWKDAGLILVAIAVSSVLAYAVYIGYGWLNEQGWIEREYDTSVWIQGNWLADEYRICEMPGNLWGELPDSAHLLCGSGDPQVIEGVWPAEFRDSLTAQEAIQLQNGHWMGLERHFHVLPVHYWGRIDRTDRTTFSWRCQKTTSGIECKALN